MTIFAESIATLFENGKRRLAKKIAVSELMELAGVTKSPAYTALLLVGKFKEHLREEAGLLVWTP